MIWHLRITPAPGQDDLDGVRLAAEARELRIPGPWRIAAERGFLVQGALTEDSLRNAAESVLADPVVETFAIAPAGGPHDRRDAETVHVLPKPGVTDPEGESALGVLRDMGLNVDACRTVRTYHVAGPADGLPRLIAKVLANEAVENAVVGPLAIDHLTQGRPYQFEKVTVAILDLSDEDLVRVSRDGQLALNLDEMKSVRDHFVAVGRDPTDCELETIAQTWSEHCSHKTLKGRIDFDGEIIDNLLKETVFKATQTLNSDWLVSVFADNAGVVRFDDDFDVCFKVETHNHPSAIDPYGGANTGLGGVIRDILGTGLGAKPIANTDVFCVAPPDFPADAVPPGVIHPRRVLEGIVAGVRDYGNRMGIPTVNGALAVDPRYLANPLVFCGTVGVIPRGMSAKCVEPGDRIVAIGGRTGRDGIHGATFSSLELTSESEAVSGGSVQIGHAIHEKMVLDVLMKARDRGLYRSLTDCGAGGFSSAVGEMAAECGAEVDLEKAPLKYEGLSYTEIWISEAQERMVLAVPPEHWADFRTLCEAEGVEATDLGRFSDTGRLVLKYDGNLVGDLAMEFLHDGRPNVARRATAPKPRDEPISLPGPDHDYNADLLAILGHWDVASKEWIVRQYDHEVQGRTVIKPLVGVDESGPGDAAVIQPVRGSTVGLSISCGINPRYGEHDPYAMAMACVDEAIRNAVAVGADPDRIALLDNFCWGNPERPETLGSLVMAAKGCHDAAIGYGSPFISGKDSLYNEYEHEGTKLAIPPTLLISAIGRVPDVRRCVTMDFKGPDGTLFLLGATHLDFGGSLWAERRGARGGRVPKPDPSVARLLFRAVHAAIGRGLVLACHDLSEGGLAVALAEMALAGGLGADVFLWPDAIAGDQDSYARHLFAESPSRFVVEVRREDSEIFPELLRSLAATAYVRYIGHVTPEPRLVIADIGDYRFIDLGLGDLKAAWQRPLHPGAERP